MDISFMCEIVLYLVQLIWGHKRFINSTQLLKTRFKKCSDTGILLQIIANHFKVVHKHGSHTNSIPATV